MMLCSPFSPHSRDIFLLAKSYSFLKWHGFLLSPIQAEDGERKRRSLLVFATDSKQEVSPPLPSPWGLDRSILQLSWAPKHELQAVIALLASLTWS